MKKSNKRAVIGMAGALALGTAVSAGTLAPAHADATGQYTCTLSLGAVPMAVSGSLTLPASVPAGSQLGGKPASMGVTIPAAVVTALATALPGLQSVGGTASGVMFPVTGGSALPLNDLTIGQTAPTADGLTLADDTTTKSVRAPKLPGDYPVTMPSAFSFTPIANIAGTIAPLPAVPCTTDSPQTVATMHVVKAAPKITLALLNKPITTAKQPKIGTTVKYSGLNATGKVVAVEGTKQLASGTLSSGKRTLVLPKLSKGSHTIKVLYKGSASTKAGSKSITFTVTRR